MDISALMQAVSTTDCHISLLTEGGAFRNDTFLRFYEKYQPQLYSLYQHPQLQQAKMMGPWLLEIENAELMASLMDICEHGIGVIFHTSSTRALATQLCWGCTPVSPDRKTVISRFYIREVLQALAHCTNTEWHKFLFQDISAWWTPDEYAWTPIAIPPSTAKHPRDHAVRIDKETWAKIADRSDVENVLSQWQKRPSAQIFSACVQKNMVIKALNKAQRAGLFLPEEQKLYALVWLDGKKVLLESEYFQKTLPEIVRGKRRLFDVLMEAERS